MAFDVYEYGSIAVFVFIVVFFVVFYPMMVGKTVEINTSAYDRDYGYSQSFNRSAITLLSVTTTSSTTTSTLKMFFLNSSGAASLVFNTDNGGILLNCGSDPSVMDKIYMAGIGKIYAAYMSKLDEAHIGGCPRTFISMVPIAVFDDGGNHSDVWFKNYEYVLGKHRYEFAKRNPLVVSGLESRMLWTEGGNSAFRFRFGNVTVFYLSGCDGCFEKVASAGNNMYLVDNEISEDLLVSKQPKYLVMRNSSVGFEGLCRKYGVALYVLSGGDVGFMTNGNSVEPIKK